MGSSKMWRTGRWFWHCNTQNRASDWKDHWACSATSRLTYSTDKEAEQAGRQHANRFGHNVNIARIRKT